MAHLTIKEIGVIKYVDIDLNKINVIIGPQSSGKSTICKIACYCAWVEKKISLVQDFVYFMKDHNFYKELVTFHKLAGYFMDESFFEYETDVIKFSYLHKNGNAEFEWKDRYGYKQNQIAYIPSERNLISAIDNWFEVKFKDNNIRNFMIDWEDARKVYTREDPLSILKLGVQYYFDGATRKDLVIVDDNGTTLDLTNTSSGLQSLIPLEVVSQYLTNYIFAIDGSNSVQDKSSANFFRQRVYEELFEVKEINFPSEGLFVDRSLDDGIKLFRSKEDYDRYNKTINRMLYIQYTKLFIEEPEQNIFPETQRDFLYSILELMKSKEDNSLFITTHSPYILYALNNCIMGFWVKNKMPLDEQKELLSLPAWIDPALVSVYEITDEGILKSILTEKTKLIGKHYFNRVRNGMMDEYYDMLDYLEIDEDEK
ncbi:hypothetical protein AGMMS49574_27910 [Bacteroidia bacterium]|nr:hypothetical protein AGMMS49574_27910 [Bacteroidia bacterium]